MDFFLLIITKMSHKFWNTQPVPQSINELQIIGPINSNKDEIINQTADNLPIGYYWDTPNLDTPNLDEIYLLLRDHYVKGNQFRFDYSRDFIRWALAPPNWIVGVRDVNKHRLVSIITGIPVEILIDGKLISMCEINFLCVHEKLREKRLAPTLIKEITRRVKLSGIWQAIYTSGTELPTPFGTAKYYPRASNKAYCQVKKLHRVIGP